MKIMLSTPRDTDTSKLDRATIKNLETMMDFLTALSTSLVLNDVTEVSDGCTMHIDVQQELLAAHSLVIEDTRLLTLSAIQLEFAVGGTFQSLHQ